ncbi:uncharacterized protein LOC141877203 isoform X1 [Acropora palmata]|uniref:uncharacterized protein LOC141877203 isoform X1 n=1 Tax=Acropora palmata TaxID=6131 RepID=UPI003DA17D70
MAYSSSAVNDSVTEDDIPGASLAGRNPSSLKNEELRFWLRCRGDSLKGLKTKALLVKRIESDKKVNARYPLNPISFPSKRKKRRQSVTSCNTCVLKQGHGAEMRRKSLAFYYFGRFILQGNLGSSS